MSTQNQSTRDVRGAALLIVTAVPALFILGISLYSEGTIQPGVYQTYVKDTNIALGRLFHVGSGYSHVARHQFLGTLLVDESQNAGWLALPFRSDFFLNRRTPPHILLPIQC